ncbi:MAG: FG-GAP repeat domain-containing protein [Planctomycetota bacterium]|jgi:hypothetical protein
MFSRTTLTTGLTNPYDIIVTDINGDTIEDFIVVSFFDIGPPADPGTLTIFQGKDGSLPLDGEGIVLPTGVWPTSINLSDISGDGVNDIVVACKDSGELVIYTGRDGGFPAPKRKVTLSVNKPGGIVEGDFNGDGLKSFVTNDSNNYAILYRQYLCSQCVLMNISANESNSYHLSGKSWNIDFSLPAGAALEDNARRIRISGR